MYLLSEQVGAPSAGCKSAAQSMGRIAPEKFRFSYRSTEVVILNVNVEF